MKPISLKGIFLTFLGLGFMLYGNTLGHEYVLDDAIVITDNAFTKKGFSGIWDQLTNDQFTGFYGEKKELVSGGRYRPLSMVVFNIQYAIAGESPFLSHLFNLLFYVLNGFLLYYTLNRLLPKTPTFHPKLNLALICSLLWFFHPIHTEVVANIKGLDEIMAFCFELMSLNFILNYLTNKKGKELLLSFVFFFLALLSKESAITWLAVIPLSIYFFKGSQFKKSGLAFSSILGASILWFFIRYQIVGGGISNVADNLMNDPFLESSVSEKYATIMLTLGKYIQLLFFPHPLTYDYYPKHIPIVSWSNPLVILSALTYLLLLVWAVAAFFKKSIYSFGILFFFITLSIASNIVFPIGAFMNERFVYVSSLGFSLMLAYFLVDKVPKLLKNKTQVRQISMAAFSIVLLLYAGKTISRNPVWKNNLSLSTHDANISVKGAKSNVMAGGILSEEAVKQTNPVERREMLEKSIFYLNRALNTYPEYIDALILMGNAQWELTKSPKNAMSYYYRILQISPTHANTWQNILFILEKAKDVDYKIKTYKNLLKFNPNKVEVYLNLGRAYGREKNNLSEAINYLEKGRQVAPQNFEVLSNLGTAYGFQKNYLKAIEVLKLATKLKPEISKTYVDLGLSYYFSGQEALAKQTFDKAVRLDKNINRDQFPI